jgi:hypothetical protein
VRTIYAATSGGLSGMQLDAAENQDESKSEFKEDLAIEWVMLISHPFYNRREISNIDF